MEAECYLVIGRRSGYRSRARVVRATKNRPTLDSDEAMIKLRLELPDDLFDAPLVTVPVEIEKALVAVAVDSPEEPTDDDEEA